MAHRARLDRLAQRLSPRRRAWHRAMMRKYLQAYEAPWLPVLPDPPLPK